MPKGKMLIQGKLAPELFNELLNGPLSTRIAYSRAQPCPCRDERGGGSNPKCPVCSGLGYVWTAVTPSVTRTYTLTRAPLLGHEDQEQIANPTEEIVSVVDEHGTEYPASNAQVRPDGSVTWTADPQPQQYVRYTVTTTGAVLRAGVQGVMSRREFQMRGEYDVLDLQMSIDRYLDDGETINPAWDCGEYDRFTLLDAWRRHSQHVKRGINGQVGDLLLYRNVRDLTVSSIQNDQLINWEEGQDYTLTDGAIQWNAGRGPQKGTYYSVQGQVRPEYYVFQALPQLRHEDGLELPRRIVLKGFENFANRKPATPVR